MIRITSLDAWIRKKTGMGSELTGRLFTDALEKYQLRKLNETIAYVRRNAPFYRDCLASFPEEPLTALSDLQRIPFTTPSDLVRDPYRFLAVRQDDVARTVTLRTSGSTGEAKQLFFTEGDLELTMDFFHHGVSTFAQPGQRIMILLPGERSDSVGDLLVRGLRRRGLDAIAYGPVLDPLHAARAIASFGAHCLVGIPTQVLAVARSRPGAAIGTGGVESIVLTTDYVPRPIVRALEETWGCRVFNHYGMTEMGLGGGFECEALTGYHLREVDLCFEIVDPETGERCADGIIGEVVFTTLTRRGMPLIRYRTGDIARFIPEPCPCGSSMRLMERVGGRWDGDLRLGPGTTLRLADMDEALFQLPALLDFRVTVIKGQDGKFRLHADVHEVEGNGLSEGEVLRTMMEVDAIRTGIGRGYLELPTVRFSPEGRWTTTGVSKRKIVTIN